MIQILQIVLPVFIVIAIGFGATKIGFFNAVQIDGLNKFAQSLGIPVLVFLGISSADLSNFNLALYGTYYGPAAIVFGVATIGAVTILKRDKQDAVSIGFTALFSNTVMIGLPIMERAYGPESLDTNYALIAFHAPFCYVLGITTMEFTAARNVKLLSVLRDVAQKTFSNVLMLAILLGIATNLLSLRLPGPLYDILSLIGQSGLPVALFALGGILARYKLKETLNETIFVVLVSLILFPLLVWFAGSIVFSLPQQMLKTAVITAALSTGINAFIFASLYDRAKGVAATSIVISTALSIVTVSAWLAILG